MFLQKITTICHASVALFLKWFVLYNELIKESILVKLLINKDILVILKLTIKVKKITQCIWCTICNSLVVGYSYLNRGTCSKINSLFRALLHIISHYLPFAKKREWQSVVYQMRAETNRVYIVSKWALSRVWSVNASELQSFTDCLHWDLIIFICLFCVYW